jgi:hypothetical protein
VRHDPSLFEPKSPRLLNAAAFPGSLLFIDQAIEPEQRLDVPGQPLIVDYRWRPEQQPLRPRRQAAEELDDAVLDRNGQARQVGHQRRLPGAISHTGGSLSQ